MGLKIAHNDCDVISHSINSITNILGVSSCGECVVSAGGSGMSGRW